MRFSAKKVLAENCVVKITDTQSANSPGRATKLAELEAQALEFANDVLLDLELPNNPDLTVGQIKGFENLDVDINKTSGVIVIYASLKTLSGQKLRFDMPIPISKGSFYRPSVIVVNGAKKVLSQTMIDNLIKKTEQTRPHAENIMTPSIRVFHDELLERDLFSSPRTDDTWWDHVWERL